MTLEELKKRQAEAGRQSAKARGEHSRKAIVAAALQLVNEGKPIKRGEVLKIVKATANINGGSTVRRHWPAVMAALAERRPAWVNAVFLSADAAPNSRFLMQRH